MKRRISIGMGLSLVAVFAIIATLGLLSLNQANTVQADGHQVDAGEAVEIAFEFAAPEDLQGAPRNLGDSIILNLAGFTVPGSSDAEVKVYVNGAELDAAGYSDTGHANTIAIRLGQLGSPAADVGIDGGATVKIMIMDSDIPANDVEAPVLEGMYPVSVSIDIGGAGGVDHEGLASMTLHAQASVTSTMAMEDVATAKEDVASNLSISFRLPEDVGLSVRGE